MAMIRFAALLFSLFSFAQAQTLCSEMNPAVQIEAYQAEQIIPLLPMLNTWAEREFSRYPYLLSSPKDQIVCPSDLVFVNSSDAMIAVANNQGKMTGIAAMICFDSPALHSMYFGRFHLIEKMQALGIDYSRMLYVAYFLTAPECHNDEHIVHALYSKVVDFAQQKGKSQLCFMDDIAQHDHPLKPIRKTFIEPWGAVICGFSSMNMQISIAWPTVDLDGTVKELEHTLEFFVKDF
jgi:hypothetical protein